MTRRTLLTLVTSVLMITGTYAQKGAAPEMDFGKVSKAELEMTAYDKDTSAVAVVLFDYGRFTPNRAFRHTRIKILKNPGVDFGSVTEIAFNDEEMRGLKATTYNLEGGKMVESKMKESSVFKEKYSEFADFLKFALPNVKVGSVIEYKYDLHPQNGLIYVGGREWEFQRSIPTIYSEFVFEKYEHAGYDKLIQGYHPTTVFEEDGGKLRLVLTNIPAYSQETHAPSYRNFISKVRVTMSHVLPPQGIAREVNATWENVAKLYRERIFSGDNLEGMRFLKDDASTIASGETTAAGKLAAIYKYIKSKLAWNEVDALGTITPHVIFDKGIGNSADINLSLLAMLRYAGIEAHPVLISTRNYGMVRKELPEIRQFRRVIVAAVIDKQSVLLDATDRMLPLEFLPEQCLNGEGLMVLDGQPPVWVELKNGPKFRSKLGMTGEFEITATGEMEGKVDVTRTGYDAHDARKEHAEKGESSYKATALATADADVSNFKVSGIDNLAEAVKEHYDIRSSSHSTTSGDVIYLEPVMFERLEQDGFNSTEREYPIDFVYPREVAWSFKFKIPDGYVVDEMPKPYAGALPEGGGRFVFSVTEKEGVITFASQFVLARPVFSQLEYKLVQEFYRTVGAKQQEQIVLKRKS